MQRFWFGAGPPSRWVIAQVAVCGLMGTYVLALGIALMLWGLKTKEVAAAHPPPRDPAPVRAAAPAPAVNAPLASVPQSVQPQVVLAERLPLPQKEPSVQVPVGTAEELPSEQKVTAEEFEQALTGAYERVVGTTTQRLSRAQTRLTALMARSRQVVALSLQASVSKPSEPAETGKQLVVLVGTAEELPSEQKVTAEEFREALAVACDQVVVPATQRLSQARTRLTSLMVGSRQVVALSLQASLSRSSAQAEPAQQPGPIPIVDRLAFVRAVQDDSEPKNSLQPEQIKKLPDLDEPDSPPKVDVDRRKPEKIKKFPDLDKPPQPRRVVRPRVVPPSPRPDRVIRPPARRIIIRYPATVCYPTYYPSPCTIGPIVSTRTWSVPLPPPRPYVVYTRSYPVAPVTYCWSPVYSPGYAMPISRPVYASPVIWSSPCYYSAPAPYPVSSYYGGSYYPCR